MSKVFIILGILLTLVGAGFSYVNFTDKTKLTADLETTKGTLSTTEANLKKTTGELEATTTELTTTKGTLDTTTSELTSTKGKLDVATADLTSTKDKLVAAEASVTEKTAKVEELQAQVDKSTELAAQLATLTADLTQARAGLATATADRDRLAGELVAANTKNTPAPAGGSGGPVNQIAGITGKVQAVNAGWSFVVLNLGEKDGVVPDAILDVYRDSTKVGQVKVSSVEPTISTANIVESKTGETATIEPGDRVVTRS